MQSQGSSGWPGTRWPGQALWAHSNALLRVSQSYSVAPCGGVQASACDGAAIYVRAGGKTLQVQGAAPGKEATRTRRQLVEKEGGHDGWEGVHAHGVGVE